MRAVVTDGFGGPEVLGIGEIADPVPAADEVVIDIVAAGVNRADLRQREGFYPPPPGSPETIGLECSGRISAVGSDVEGWQVGDEVCALLGGGGYAERVAVPANQVLPVPAGVSLQDAAALPEVFCTVWSTVFMMAGLKEGETFLMHGGSSGIGTAAIQLAKARGVRVIVTAGSDEKLARCRELGADVAINYRTSDFVEEVRAATDGKGVDVILDPIGGSYVQRNFQAIGEGGRVFCLGMQESPEASIDIRTLMGKRGSLIGATLRSRPSDQKGAITASVRENVWPLIESGAISPVIYRRYPLEQAAEAHELVASSAHIGKVLLDIAD